MLMWRIRELCFLKCLFTYLLTFLLCCFALLSLLIIKRQRIPRYTEFAVFRSHFSIMSGSGQVGHACSRRTKMKGIDGATRPTAGARIRTLDRARSCVMINGEDYSSSRRWTNSANASGIKLARYHVLTTHFRHLIEFLCREQCCEWK